MLCYMNISIHTHTHLHDGTAEAAAVLQQCESSFCEKWVCGLLRFGGHPLALHSTWLKMKHETVCWRPYHYPTPQTSKCSSLFNSVFIKNVFLEDNEKCSWTLSCFKPVNKFKTLQIFVIDLSDSLTYKTFQEENKVIGKLFFIAKKTSF